MVAVRLFMDVAQNFEVVRVFEAPKMWTSVWPLAGASWLQVCIQVGSQLLDNRKWDLAN